jgi:uncharacterized protein VirK/YbjX
MRDFDINKEAAKTNFDYGNFWKEDEDDEIKDKLKNLPKGEPRKGIKGKYIKRKNHITQRQISYSYARGIKSIRESEGF